MSNPGEFVWKNHLIIKPHNCLQFNKCDYNFVELYVHQKNAYQNCKLSRRVISE